jgi:hypothetical protein
MRFSLRYPAAAAALSLPLLGAAMRPADPIMLSSYLVGRWACTSTAGGVTTKYEADYGYVLGGKWIRTINHSKKYQSEDMMTYAGHQWTVIDMEPTRTMSVLTGPDTGLAHIALKTVYPRSGLTVTFDRASMTNYRLTFGGTVRGKPAHWVDTCTKV